MRGVNFGGWFSQIDAIAEKDPAHFPGTVAHIESFMGKEDIQRVKGWGFDHIRLPLDWHNAFDADIRPKEDVLRLLDAAVDAALASGLDIIFDLHKCPGHDFYDGTMRDQAFFSDPSLRRDCLRVWEHLAERYGGKPGVMLDLLNEPVAPDARTWNDVKDELAKAVRKMAPKATLLIASNLWNNASQFKDLRPIDDGNAVYSFHFYNPLIFTHQRAPWCPGSAFTQERSYPGTYEIIDDGTSRVPLDEAGAWDRDRLAKALEPVFGFRKRYGLPVACNEFGVYMGGPDSRSRYAWLRDLLGLFNENDIGWTYWNYKNLDFGIMSKGESLFDDAPQYQNPDRVDLDLLDILRSH
jgi:aryl-phospho-beta-D-glucosidase BglC (GH1 family)